MGRLQSGEASVDRQVKALVWLTTSPARILDQGGELAQMLCTKGQLLGHIHRPGGLRAVMSHFGGVPCSRRSDGLFEWLDLTVLMEASWSCCHTNRKGPLTSRWMLCSSLAAASFSVQVFGDMGTEPEDMVDEWLVTSDVESRVTPETGLAGTPPSPFSSPAMGGIAVVSSVLSGTVMGREYGLYLSRGRTAFRKGCRCTAEEAAEEAAAAAAMYVYG
ncbi:hypothetical protein EYF80_008512 [Liparis tanakae]|uniref:Uncharacterized protein n=1 Tax=Liparis tanakae TaxID=230148 RepID=A0A4Z2IUC6_9TELE|nr:hypothetical protein EYF80_008512 [Liparis tanakae]